MSKDGWSAKGFLRPLWNRYPGGRDQLAEDVGLKHGSTLSSINSGDRNLGLDLGSRLAERLSVTLLELGAPVSLTGEPERTLFDRLEEFAEQVERGREALLEALASIDVRLSRIEELLETRGDQGQTQP